MDFCSTGFRSGGTGGIEAETSVYAPCFTHVQSGLTRLMDSLPLSFFLSSCRLDVVSVGDDFGSLQAAVQPCTLLGVVMARAPSFLPEATDSGLDPLRLHPCR